MTFWREAGFTYVRYSNVAARMLRHSLKPEFKTEALKRDEASVKFTQWKDGKPIRDANSVPVGSASSTG